MTKLEQAARQALETLENYGIDGTKSVGGIKCTEAITALREALAGDNMSPTEQAEQEPVACIIHTEEGDYLDWNSKGYCFYTGETPLYATPVRTKDLTDVDLWNLWEKSDSNIEFARAVIAADREKNK